jgi:hypothetical protein
MSRARDREQARCGGDQAGKLNFTSLLSDDSKCAPGGGG